MKIVNPNVKRTAGGSKVCTAENELHDAPSRELIPRMQFADVEQRLEYSMGMTLLVINKNTAPVRTFRCVRVCKPQCLRELKV